MKTAEDFRNSFGETEESFRHCVRQTLMHLEQKEEKPVKKKISLGLVLAMVMVLVTVGAVAAEQWGILSFLKGQGKTPSEELLDMHTGSWVREEDLVKLTITEGLYEADVLYLAVTAEPLEENTLIVPRPEDAKTYRTDEITMNSAMATDAYAEEMTVLDYAKEMGFEHVVLLEMPTLHANSIGGVKGPVAGKPDVIHYELMENGAMRFILQKRIEYKLEGGFPEKVEEVSLTAMGYKSDVKDEGAWLYGVGHNAFIQYELYKSALSRRSIETDAHDIVGYRGFVEYVSITPYDDYAAVTIRMNKNRQESDHSWMSGPNWAVLDEEGNRLCYVDIKLSQAIFQDDRSTESSELHYGTIPLECVPQGDQFILQAENWRNYNIVYDKYTYTLK